MKDYRKIIRDLRIDRDLKQSDVAAVLGTTQQHYSNYENGENEMPTKAFVVLADYYDVSVDYLLGRPSSKEGYEMQNMQINTNTTAGVIISDIITLSLPNRDAVVDFIFMQKLKEEYHRKKEKNDNPTSTD
ncbi:MAG: helix-turn-helix domain-containing protein [Clostridiales bacterium]|jgi:transcriptional regulator with XRE-family HTH domain|nr:helix-turn-helix domain-containing protein [Clostridiales bacterium]